MDSSILMGEPASGKKQKVLVSFSSLLENSINHHHNYVKYKYDHIKNLLSVLTDWYWSVGWKQSGDLWEVRELVSQPSWWVKVSKEFLVTAQYSPLNLVLFCSLRSPGKAKTKEARQTIINPDWNFEKMGIGGLDKEFSDIFRRAFASRVFPPDIVEQMGTLPFSGLQ